ncbi:MAG: hypothetical protein M1825_001263 [Sarcosagium campestre]|nr:MAG: hypothetical protein M1825_001263 [Sarcosagium campestre]
MSTFHHTSPNPRKRPMSEDNEFQSIENRSQTASPNVSLPSLTKSSLPTSPSLDGANDSENPNAGLSPQRYSSPLSSCGSFSSTVIALGTVDAIDQTQNANHGPDAPKRRKLTAVEKEQRQHEKEIKEQQKAELRAKREEERRIKEEDRRRKDDEREGKKKLKEIERRKREQDLDEKKRQKDEEKRLKEDEKLRAEEEKRKKEKAQLRLNSFFSSKPKSDATDAAHNIDATGNVPSVSSTIDDDGALKDGQLASAREKGSSLHGTSAHTDFKSTFPPFYLQSNVVLAPYNRFGRDADSATIACNHIDTAIQGNSQRTSSPIEHRGINMIELCHIPPRKVNRKPLPPTLTVKEVIARVNDPAHLSNDSPKVPSLASTRQRTPAEDLKSIPIKYLRYAEDFRPPYRGTFTQLPVESSGLRKGRNPFQRALPHINYDYDSEAEWEEPDPEDGEDLNSEGEEENGSDDGADEMDGFLDDDDDMPDAPANAASKRRLVVGALEPVCSGLVWDTGSRTRTEHMEDSTPNLRMYRMEVMQENLKLPVDPFSTSYWSPPPRQAMTPVVVTPAPEAAATSTTTAMKPPRAPLYTISRPNGNTASSLPLPVIPKVQNKRLIEPELLEDFKMAVKGSDLTKAGLIEVLKKRFPKASKDAIKTTLGVIAARVGAKEADKRWTIIHETPGAAG